ncbi:MAG: ferritin-like domain-containing protein [Actinomycetia bacterium]|nr:ferritin-like domain-containing protein [Actinomycetes bacterium]MCH9800950.1 ferritin-like domain-containing protein [Actinomycetes bacterium]
MSPTPDDPAVLDLLGLIACGELFAFENLTKDSALSASLSAKAQLGAIACGEFAHFTQVRDRIVALGGDPDELVNSYIPILAEFHNNTAPRDLLEGLLKVYVGDGIAADFGREIAQLVDPDTKAFIDEVLSGNGQGEFVVPYVQQALSEDPGAAGRLALWGRRLMGEALAQAQRVAADRPALAQLVIGGVGSDGAGLADFSNMLARLTERHSERMVSLGLTP